MMMSKIEEDSEGKIELDLMGHSEALASYYYADDNFSIASYPSILP